MYYRQAVRKNFDNASRRYFITNLMRYASSAKQEYMDFVSMGTSRSGESQPGSSILTKKVAKYRNERTPTPSSTSS